MLVRAPLVEAEQDGSIRIQDLTKVIMDRRRPGLAKERLVPSDAARNVADANDRPCTFHRIASTSVAAASPSWRCPFASGCTPSTGLGPTIFGASRKCAP